MSGLSLHIVYTVELKYSCNTGEGIR